MTMFTADPTADKGSTFPVAEYFLTCTDVQSLDKDGRNARKSSKGDPQYVLEMTVAEGQYKNRKLWHYLTFIPPVKGVNNGHGMTIGCLKGFGLPYEGELDIERDLGPEKFLGVTVRAKVKIEPAKTVNGKTFEAKNSIDRFLVVDDPSRLPPPAQSDTSFDPGTMEAEQQPAAAAAASARTAVPPPAAAQPARARAPWRRP